MRLVGQTMQIFLSYSHVDLEFARLLTAALRQASVDVWMDEERMRGGNSTQKQIAHAAQKSAHAIFVVSRSWLESDWTRKELSFFETRPECRRIAVLLAPHGEIRDELPPALTHVSHIEWLNDSDVDGTFWKVYCAVHDREPGPRHEWAQRGRDLKPDGSGPLPLPPAPAFEAPSVFCNRHSQWSMLDPLSTQRQHQIIFVPGARGEAHDSFIRRIELRLQTAFVRPVAWSWRGAPGSEGRPACEAEFREAIAQALDVHPSALVPKLKALLARRNMFLIHERICDDFDDPELVRYYVEYVPALVQQVGPVMALKCVQSIEWIDRSLRGRLIDLLTARSAPQDARRARQLMHGIEREMPPGFTVKLLPELATITRQDILDLCRTYDLSSAEVSRLFDRIKASSRTSEDMLRTIDDCLREWRRRHPTERDPHGPQFRLATVPR